ncbi:hypothetical protein [Thiohalorhabdus methylotrophus]|uniref:Phospholipid/glycerol acyltransferase domain-containing protein n=1 Tax=Thiohalorhabdus methylotrophus TaxID=3242694 RepID=A0ABV4TX23_9GAMM
MVRMHLRSRFTVQAAGLANGDASGPVLVVSNHRRDTDGPLVGDLMMGLRNAPFGEGLPHFVAREDLFRRDFFREYLVGWPGWTREALSRLRMQRLLRLLNVHPMRRIPERTLGEVLEEVREACGNLPLERVLRVPWVRCFESLGPAPGSPARIDEALGNRYLPLLRMQNGLRRLTLERFRAVKGLERSVISRHLEEIRRVLDRGGTVHMVPEGAVSPHGGPCRVRDGLHVLLQGCRCRPRVVPLGITYDDVTAGRPRVFMNLGPGWRDGGGGDRRERNQSVMRAILLQTTLTLTQAGSAYVMAAARKRDKVAPDQLEAHVEEEAEAYRRAGARVDEALLDPGRRRRRVHDFLRFGVKHGVLERGRGDSLHVRESALGPPDPWLPAGKIPYSANEHATFARYWACPEWSLAREAWALKIGG